MDQYFYKHKSLVTSLAYLMVGLLLFGYSNFYSRNLVDAGDALKIADILATEGRVLQALKREADERKLQAEKDGSAAIRSLPVFLTHINTIAQDTKVIIDELMPNRDGKLKFTLKIRTDYYTFLRFASRLESLNVSINDQQVRPFNPGANPPIHAIEFSITPRNDAAPLTDERLTRMQTQVGESNKRNPFQRFAFNAKTLEVTKQIELTWIHRLTSIGRSGNKTTATINNREYAEGDDLDGMSITKIETDRVFLTKRDGPDGITEYLLKRRVSSLSKNTP